MHATQARYKWSTNSSRRYEHSPYTPSFDDAENFITTFRHKYPVARKQVEKEKEMFKRRRRKNWGKNSKNNDNRFFNNFILYFTLIIKKKYREKEKKVWKEISDILWDVNGTLRESAHFSVTLNDYFVHTFAVSERRKMSFNLMTTKKSFYFPLSKAFNYELFLEFKCYLLNA